MIAIYARRVAVELVVYALILALWTFELRHADLGSTLEVAHVGAVLAAVLGGLRTGVDLALDAEPWLARRALVGDTPRDIVLRRVAARLSTPLTAGLLAAIVAAVWSLWGKEPLGGILQAQAVLLSVFVASLGLGASCARVLRADRLAIALGVLCWAPILTAFAWVPALVPHSAPVLSRALNANPMMGVLSALGRKDVQWNPLFYGKLPYAEYAIRIRGAGVHTAGWLAVGVALVAVYAWSLRRRWVS